MKSLYERATQRLIETRPCPHNTGFVALDDGTDRGRCNGCSRAMTQHQAEIGREEAEEHEIAIKFLQDLERKTLAPKRPVAETIARLIRQTPISERGAMLADVGQALSDKNQSFIGSLFFNASAMHTFGTAIQELRGQRPKVLDAKVIPPGAE